MVLLRECLSICWRGSPVLVAIQFQPELISKTKIKTTTKTKKIYHWKNSYKYQIIWFTAKDSANLNILTLSEDEKVSLEALRFELKRNNKRDFKVHSTNNQSRDGGWTMHRALNSCLLFQILTLCKNERDSQRNKDINFSSFCHFAKKSSWIDIYNI